MVNSVGYVLRFLTKLCRSLLCDNLFSHLPYPGSLSASEKTQEREDGRPESGEEGCFVLLQGPPLWLVDEAAVEGRCCP